MIYPDTIRDYLIDLQLDLEFNRNRLKDADPEAVPVILRSIRVVEKDIARCMEILEKAERNAS